MKTETVRTLRNDYAQLLRRVESGEPISISRRGKIVARLVPVEDNLAQGVDWSASAARAITNTGKAMSAAKSHEALTDSQGKW